MGRKLCVYVCIRTCVHACMCLCVMQATHSDILQASISLKSKGTEFGDAALLLTAWVQGCMGLPWQRGCFRGIRQLSWPPFPNDPLISETPTGSNQPHGFTLPEQYQLVLLLPFLRAPVPRISVMAPNSPPYSRQCPQSLEDGCCLYSQRVLSRQTVWVSGSSRVPSLSIDHDNFWFQQVMWGVVAPWTTVPHDTNVPAQYHDTISGLTSQNSNI